jgi:hypothetical protein
MEIPERLKVLKIYNKIRSTGEFPSEWTEFIVIPGKDPNEPTSYRPISLTSCMCKTMERIIHQEFHVDPQVVIFGWKLFLEPKRNQEWSGTGRDLEGNPVFDRNGRYRQRK